MSTTNLASLFNPQTSVVEAPQSVRNTDEYKVSFKDGKGGIYESVIRFVPFYANPEKSIMAKTVSFVKNPVTQQGMYVDDPRTVGSFSPIIDMFFKFYNSGNEIFKEFGKKHLSSKPQYAALVQIIKDDQHPELVGKIKVFKFGKKLYDKLTAEEHPAMGQGFNPFHPIYGRYFYLKCTSQSGFNNFDQSYFFDNKNQQNQILPMGIWYMNPATGKMDVCTEQTDQQVFADYLAANSPDLARYDYTPWTAEQEKHVNDTLRIMADYMQTGSLQGNLQVVNSPSTPAAGMTVNSSPVFPGATVPAPQAPTAPVAPAQPSFGIPGVGMSTSQAPVTPAAPVAPAPVAPAAPSMGAFSMGQNTISPGIATPGNPGPSTIIGVDIPTVEPAVAPSGGVTTLGGSIGNIDDVIANL